MMMMIFIFSGHYFAVEVVVEQNKLGEEVKMTCSWGGNYNNLYLQWQRVIFGKEYEVTLLRYFIGDDKPTPDMSRIIQKDVSTRINL